VLNMFSGVMLLVLDVVFCKCVDSACSGAHDLQGAISPVFLLQGAHERELVSPALPLALGQVPLLAYPSGPASRPPSWPPRCAAPVRYIEHQFLENSV
jgi:hypothetical protein